MLDEVCGLLFEEYDRQVWVVEDDAVVFGQQSTLSSLVTIVSAQAQPRF